MPFDTSNKKILAVVGVATFFAVGSLIFMLAAKQLSLPKKLPTRPTELERETTPIPHLTPKQQEEEGETQTLTPERREIISKLENHVVTIQNRSFSSQSLTIKLHDQVEWENKDNETHQIKGENWGNVPIRPGRSFTQAFKTAGTFTYSCALHPEMTGTIVVK